MKKWALLLILFAIPVLAQPVDSARIKSVENSIQTLDRRMEKIEERWVEIGKDAEASGVWARWILIFGIGLAALFLGFITIFTLINISRIRRDLDEVKEKKEQIDRDLKDVLEKKTQVDAFLNSVKKSQEEIVRELTESREERKKRKQEGKSVRKIDREVSELRRKLNLFEELGVPLSAEGWSEKGVELYGKNLYKEASNAFEEAIRLKPDFAEAHNNRGATLGKLGRHEEALKAYEEAIRLEPNYATAHNGRASALIGWGATLKGKQVQEKFVEARKSAEKAVELSKGKKGYYNLACTLAQLVDLDEALESLKKSKESSEDFPGNSYAWEDDDLASLRKKYPREFEKIVGEEPKPTESKKK